MHKPYPRLAVPRVIIPFLTFLLFCPVYLCAQWVQTGPLLNDSTAQGDDQQAYIVDISDDGLTAVAGYPSGNSGSGTFIVYTLANNQWVKQFSYTGSQNSHLGGNLAISGDGKTIGVGNFNGSGYYDSLWIFVKTANSWKKQYTKKIPSGPYTLNISDDGNTILTGRVVMVRNGSQWAIEDTLRSTDPNFSTFNNNASLAGDGNTALVTLNAIYNWIFVRQGNKWVEQARNFTLNVPGDSTNTMRLRTFPVIAKDGNALVAEFGTVSFTRGMVSYHRTGNTWTQDSISIYLNNEARVLYNGDHILYKYYQAGIYYLACYDWIGGQWVNSIPSPAFPFPTFKRTGHIAYAMDPTATKFLLANSYTDSTDGGVYCYTRTGNNWAKQASKIYEPNLNGSARQGLQVVMSGNGTTLAYAGAMQSNNGNVWVYVRQNKQWVKQALLHCPDGPYPLAKFGTGISLSHDGNTLAIGAPDAYDTATSGYGAIFIYQRTGNIWALSTRLHGTQQYANYGGTVSLSADGKVLLTSGAINGGAYVYEYTGGAWQQPTRLYQTSGDGSTVALSADGKTAAIGNQTTSGGNGAYTMFTRGSSTWSTGPGAINLRSSALASYDQIPRKLALSHNGTRVAAARTSNGSTRGGVVFHNYSGTGTTWNDGGGICTNGCTTGDENGRAIYLSASGDTLIEMLLPSALSKNTDMYVWDGTQWNFVYELPNIYDSENARSQGSSGDGDFLSASADLEYIAVGAANYQGNNGGIYIYKRSTLKVAVLKNQAVSCPQSSNGKIVLAITGGKTPYTINWSTGASGTDSLVNLSTGTYTVTITDADTTVLVRQYTVGARSNMDITAGASTTDCAANTASIALSISGAVRPYHTVWNTQPAQTTDTAFNLAPGTYSFTVTDSFGCTFTDAAVVSSTQSNFLWVSTTAVQPNCSNNGSATAVLYGGQVPYTYLWSNGSTYATDSLLGPGTYGVTVTDKNGCNAKGSATLGNYCNNIISGRIFFDNNNNCLFDNSDIPANSYTVFATNGSSTAYGSTDNAGNYEIAAPTAGNFSVSIGSSQCGYTLCTGSNYPVMVNLPSTGDTLGNTNFALVDTGFDLSLSMQAPVINPGFAFDTKIYYGNLKSLTVPTGVLTIVYDSAFTLNSSVPMYSNIDPLIHTITWNLSNIGPKTDTSQFITLNFTLYGRPDNHFVPLYCSVTPTAQDCNTDNNYFTGRLWVVGSFDPNAKECSPSGQLMPNDKTINYTIHFQNTGTDSTHFVAVKDTLSPYLDPASIKTLATSHKPYTFHLSEQGIATWSFNPLALPDSGTDFVNSQGYVTFNIGLKESATPGTVINNTAHIYFDYNEVVTTNTVSNTVSLVTGNTEPMWQNSISVRAFPNPFTDLTHIITIGINQKFDFELYEATGRKVHEIKALMTNEFDVSRNNLAPGIYLYRIVMDNKPQAYGKLIIN